MLRFLLGYAPLSNPRPHMPRLLFVLLVAVSSGAGAIVIRDDVDDAQYRVSPAELPALADLPGEGHGVLIAPRWVVTAAHAVTWQHKLKWKRGDGSGVVLRPGVYGQTSYNIRLSSYVDWIRGAISAATAPAHGVATASGT